jgi:hypothetical protein
MQLLNLAIEEAKAIQQIRNPAEPCWVHLPYRAIAPDKKTKYRTI